MENGPKQAFTILLVDDDEDEYILLRDMAARVDRLRFTFDWVDSPEKAKLSFNSKSYDAYLVDYRLGAGNGLDLIQKMVQEGVKAPIILLTGQGSYEIDEAAQLAGAADYLVKDQLNFSLLERTIRYALEHKSIQVQLEQRVHERTRKLRAEVEERKLAQEASRQSEARFRALTETTSAAIFIVRNMEIRYANPAAKTITGYEPGELVDDSFLKLIHPDYQAALKQHGLGNGWAPDLPSRYEIKIVRKDGTERWLDLTSGLVEYEGQTARIVTAFDITERDIAEKELRQAKGELEGRVTERTKELSQANKQLQAAVLESRKRADEIDSLRRATSMLLSTLDLDLLLGNVLDAALQAIPAADKTALQLIIPRKGPLRMKANNGFKDSRIQAVQLSRSKGVTAQALTSDKPILLLEPKQSIIAAPLLLNGEPLGVLLLSCACPAAFTQSDVSLLESFAATAAVAIRNSQLHGEVQWLAVTDPLTGAYNRRGFFETSQRELDRFRRYARPLSVIYLDVDNFKSINDKHGHQCGDKILQTVVERARSHLRHVDVMGRLGGDEFAILLPETPLETAQAIAERIRQAVAGTPIAFNRKRLHITATIGVAEAGKDLLNLEDLLAHADQRLYEAKNNGRNQVAATDQPIEQPYVEERK